MKVVLQESSTRNWTATLMFALTFATATTIVPWYGFVHGYSTAAWIWFGLLLVANGMSITCGYHRLFAHATYKSRAPLRLAYLLFGAMALQNSALNWSANHRAHHQYIDDPERDPYCARRGFWFSHIGWMLRNYPSGEPELSVVRDLQRDPLVVWQHRSYLPITLAMNFGLPLLLGWLDGNILGTFLLGGVLRLVVSHHATFLINSLAHMWGARPYTDNNTARDNGVVALLTYGEGYHNFHHLFSHDYRNGVRWWQWDPSKWFIYAAQGLGLTASLKRVPKFKIQRARLETQFKHAEQHLARPSEPGKAEQVRKRVREEYSAFRIAVSAWDEWREQWLVQAKRTIDKHWERSILQSRLGELELALKLQGRRMRILQRQLGGTS